MVNYQLYHTNVLLGGQMKYDIVLGLNGQDLVATDFHITPISRSVPYNKHTKENLLQYSHQDNIASYYKKISGHFYNNYGDPNLQGIQPIVKFKDKTIDPHDSTYEMGCRRALHKIYGKQFEFFSPLWLDQIPEGSYLNFEFQVFTNQSQELPVCKRNFKFTPSKNANYHNKLVKYFNDYFTSVRTSGDGNSDVININPATSTATISGINVSTGKLVAKDLPYLLSNLFSRELPLIEFDNLIISNFKNNQLIASQLYNFNLCFNMEDILAKNIFSIVKGKSLIVKLVVAMVNGDKVNILESRDFYTNYEYIPRTFCGPVAFMEYGGVMKQVDPFASLCEAKSLNVMNHMRDNTCVSYNAVNKINPSILHWSLVKDNNYICNAYAGFSGYYLKHDYIMKIITRDEPNNDDVYNEDEIHNVNYTYGNSTNITEATYSGALNQTSWCNEVVIKETDSSIRDINYILSNAEYLSQFATSFDSKFVAGIEYNTGESPVKVCRISYIPFGNDAFRDGEANSNRLANLQGGHYLHKIDGKNIFSVVCHKSTNTIFIVSQYGKADEYLPIKRFAGILKEVYSYLMDSGPHNPNKIAQRKMASNLQYILSSAKDHSQSIAMPTTLDMVLADGPSISLTEIEYYKNDNVASSPILRIFGKLRPTFVSANSEYYNLRYSKKVMTQEELSEYNKFASTKFDPVYKSIGYYFIDDERETYLHHLDNIETHSYNENKLLILDETIETTIELPEGEKIYDKIVEFVGDYYDVCGDGLEYIMLLYKRFSSYEYKSDKNDDINNYIYSVKLELK